jgi:hypothetical protein
LKQYACLLLYVVIVSGSEFALLENAAGHEGWREPIIHTDVPALLGGLFSQLVEAINFVLAVAHGRFDTAEPRLLCRSG